MYELFMLISLLSLVVWSIFSSDDLPRTNNDASPDELPRKIRFL